MTLSNDDRERLIRLEVMLTEHISQHKRVNKWFFTVSGGSVVGLILIALPGCIRLLGTIL